jgi:Uma2 family endonuclease
MSTQTTISWEEFLAAGREDQRWEWVDGEIVYMSPAGFWHEILLLRLVDALSAYCKTHPEWVCILSNAAYTLASGNWRLPDVSLVRAERFPGGRLPTGQALFAPDIAFEILSPGNSPSQIQRKRKDYQESGVTQVWIDPEKRLVELIEPGRPLRYFTEAEPLVIPSLPGFSIDLKTLFAAAVEP